MNESLSSGEGSSARSIEPPTGRRTVDPDASVVAGLVAELEESDGTPVPYERVLQRARLEFGMGRPAVEGAVERLVEEGVVRKSGADRLVVD